MGEDVGRETSALRTTQGQSGMFPLLNGSGRRTSDGPNGAGPLWLIESAGKELTRARRYNHSLAVILMTLPGKRRALDHLTSNLRNTLRLSDLVGHLSSSSVAAVLPETTREGAQGLLRRLALSIDEDVATLTLVGVAAFPGDGVTWVGLETTARRAPSSLLGYRNAGATKPDEQEENALLAHLSVTPNNKANLSAS